MITKLAWKNIWRNKVRSSVILGAIALGLFAGTYLSSFMSGWMLSTVNGDIASNLSHVQIHDTAFTANSDIGAFFSGDTIAAAVERSGLPVALTRRLKLSGMLASANNAVGVTVKGVHPDEEKSVSSIWRHIPDSLGAFLPDGARMPVTISRKIADKLKAGLKSKLVFTFQDIRGDMQSVAFRVCGIYKTTNGMFDEGNVFARYADIAAYTGLPEGAAHEVSVAAADLEACELIAPQLKDMFSDMDVRDWGEINPTLRMSLAWTDLMAVVLLGIFLFALSFGIINTMLMAVMERTRELGVLGAIGMSKGRIFRMIMLETVFLTLAGSIAGIILGVAAIVPSMKNGIDLTFLMSDLFEDYGYGSIVYPVLSVGMFAEITVMVILAGILSALYPARKALKLNPLEAIRG
jgi:ABC-type lipoprotein release transport system permease subunit